MPARSFAAAQAAPAAHAHAAPAAHGHGSDVVVPEIVDTLEWVLDSPPTIHQFDEPPVSLFCLLLKTSARIHLIHTPPTLLSLLQIVVEIEHLDALIVKEH